MNDSFFISESLRWSPKYGLTAVTPKRRKEPLTVKLRALTHKMEAFRKRLLQRIKTAIHPPKQQLTERNITLIKEITRLVRSNQQEAAEPSRPRRDSIVSPNANVQQELLFSPEDDELKEVARNLDIVLKRIMWVEGGLYDQKIKPTVTKLLGNYLTIVTDALAKLVDYIEDESINEKIRAINQLASQVTEKDIKALIQDNEQFISCWIVNRLTALLEKLRFADTYDTVAQIVLQQLDACAYTYSVQRDLRKAIPQAEHDSNLKLYTPQTAEAKRWANELIDLINVFGGNSEQALQIIFHIIFSEREACHPYIRDCLRNKECILAPDNKEDFSALASYWISLLFPSVSVEMPDQPPREVHGLYGMLDQLVFPGKMLSIKQHLMEIIDLTGTMFNLDKGELFDRRTVEAHLYAYLKHASVLFIESKARKILGEQITQFFLKWSSCEFLEEMFAETFFPAIIDQVFVAWASSTIETNKKVVIPYFHSILLGENPEDAKKRLYGKIWSLMEDHAKGNTSRTFELEQLEKVWPSEEGDHQQKIPGMKHFLEIIEPLVEDMLSFLQGEFPRTEGSSDNISEAEVDHALEQYFKDNPSEVHEIYGDLTMSALFRFGNLGGTWTETLFRKRLKGSVSASCSSSMKEIRESPNYLAKKATDVLSEKFSTPEQIQALFLPQAPKPTKPRVEVARNLDVRVQIISNLIHDYLDTIVDQLPWWKRPARRLLPSSGDLHHTISSLFHDLLGDTSINYSLVLRIKDILNARFTEAGEQLRPNLPLDRDIVPL